MKKIEIKTEVFDINYSFYFFVKELNSTNGLTKTETKRILGIFNTYKSKDYKTTLLLVQELFEGVLNHDRRELLLELIARIDSKTQYDLFEFSVRLIFMKPLLLEESKFISDLKFQNIENFSPLSLSYDSHSKRKPYFTRVSGALLSLYFFQKLEDGIENVFTRDTEVYMLQLSDDYLSLKKRGLEANQIFMLMFSESIRQSIVSEAGSNYEDRIKNVLISSGIPPEDISKKHDKIDSSTEFDFFFEYKGKTFGIGAKRTLRERYKQFIKTVQMSPLDIMIEVTLGIDLTPEKAKSIRSHGVYIFVSDEIYESRTYLQEIEGIYPSSDFNLSIFSKLK